MNTTVCEASSSTWTSGGYPSRPSRAARKRKSGRTRPVFERVDIVIVYVCAYHIV